MKRILAFTLLLSLTVSTFAETGWGRHRKVYAVPAPGKVVVDGRLDDWDLSPQVEMFVMSETREHQNAKFAMMYDDEALYVSGVVRDDSPMMNRNDPVVRGNFGWDADSCQLRFTLDPDDGYPVNYTWERNRVETRGLGKVVLLTMWYYTDGKKPALQMNNSMCYDIPEGWEPFGIVPDDKFEAAYLMWDDGKGFTFEYRIPWTTLGAKRPFKGGDLAAASVQFNWGTPDGLHYAGLASATYDCYVPGGLPYQQAGCWGKVIFSEEGNLPHDLVEEGVAPPRPLPLTFNYDVPKAGEVSIVLFDQNNDLVRILTASSPRQAGEARDSWDGMDINGNPLPPGEYTWKGVVRDPLSIKVRMSVHNSGQPGWQTDDTSSSWGGDHGNPASVCAIPGGLLLSWEDTEAGFGIIKTDLNGKKIWGTKTSGVHITSDGERFFVSGHGYVKTVKSFDLKDTRVLNFGNGKPEVEQPKGVEGEYNVSGIECADGKLYAAYGKFGIVGVYDPQSGDLKKTLKVKGELGRIAWDAKGKRLLAVVFKDGKYSVVDVEKDKAVVTTNLDTATGIAVDQEGNIYVANRGTLQNVSVFDAKGKYVRSVGKEGGRPARGTFDENGMYMPLGIAIADDGRLWVTENADSPRRHSVWKKTEGLKTEDLKDGGVEWVFDKDFFGGGEYNTFVWMDASDPEHVYCHNTKWKIDIDAGTWRPVSTMWRAVEPNEVSEVAPGFNLRVFRANNGRMYAIGNQRCGVKLFREEGDVFKPFAGMINVTRSWYDRNYPVLRDNVEKYPSTPYHTACWWQDKNGDGMIQDDEIFVPHPGQPWMSWMFGQIDRELNVYGQGYKYPPVSIDENGQPHYDYDVKEKVAVTPTAWSDDESEIYTFWEHNVEGKNKMTFIRWNKDGTPMWGYRHNPHWADSLGYPIVKAGMLHGLTYPLWVAGEFTGICSYFATYHLMTTDGIYVGMLMRDTRDGGPLGEDTHCSEAFQGQLVKVGERYFLLGGANDGRITEIFGLDTVERLAGGTYVHTEEMADIAVKARQEYDLILAKSRKLDIQRGGRAGLEKATGVERTMDANRRFTVQATYDAQNLYFRYDVQTDIPLVNTMGDPVFIFKGGNCLDMQVLNDVSPVRLLVTRREGETLATLYRKTVPGTEKPLRFVSSSGEGFLDAVDEVTDKITLEYREYNGGFVAVVTVPQGLLGLELKPQQEVTLDVGYIFGNREGNQVIGRAYWINNGFSANVVADVPNELKLEPEEWGKAVVE